MQTDDVLNKLIFAYAVPVSKRIALKGRLNHLRNLGWPDLPKVGKGRSVEWSDRNYTEAAIALELCALGFSPERAIETTKANYAALLEAAENGEVCEIRVPPSFGEAMPRSSILVNLSALA